MICDRCWNDPCLCDVPPYSEDKKRIAELEGALGAAQKTGRRWMVERVKLGARVDELGAVVEQKNARIAELEAKLDGAIQSKREAWAENKRLKELMIEALSCQNNDCVCRQGYGLCNQCKEAFMEALKGGE